MKMKAVLQLLDLLNNALSLSTERYENNKKLGFDTYLVLRGMQTFPVGGTWGSAERPRGGRHGMSVNARQRLQIQTQIAQSYMNSLCL